MRKSFVTIAVAIATLVGTSGCSTAEQLRVKEYAIDPVVYTVPKTVNQQSN